MSKPVILQVFTVPESLMFIHGQAAFMAGHGYETGVVSAGGDLATAFAKQQKISHHTVPFTRRTAPIHDVGCLLKLCILIRRLAPAIVHGNTPKAGLLSMLAAWLVRVPIRIYEIHGFPFESRRRLSQSALILVEKLTCQLATQVLAVSASVRVMGLANGITSQGKITVLHKGSCNGVDAAEYFNPARLDSQKLLALKTGLNLPGRVIGFVGRLTRDKGIYELLQAWAVLRGAYPDVTLLLAGHPEPDFAAYTDCRTDSRIRVLGHVTDMPYYYAMMDFLVLPTHREGFGNVLIEAAAMERPAVVTRVTGTIDAVVDNQTGLFCEPRLVADLIRQLRWYLDNPAIVQEHGQRARRRVLQDFVPADIWTVKWQLYERLLAEAGRSNPKTTAL